MSIGMLALADRNLSRFSPRQEARGTGADLLWRTKANHSLPVELRLPDGSLHEPRPSRRRLSPLEAVAVRVVEYAVDDPAQPQAEGTAYRLITTLLDPEAVPGAEQKWGDDAPRARRVVVVRRRRVVVSPFLV